MMKTGGSQPERPVRRRYQIPLVVILSAWLGVSLFVWYSANVTFSVLSVKNNPGISERFSATPEGPRERALRRTAGEINRGMFHGWNRVQLAAGALLLGMMMLGGRSGDWVGGWGRVSRRLERPWPSPARPGRPERLPPPRGDSASTMGSMSKVI